MRRHLPSFTSLQCFEASARHMNFTRAAEELNLTQSAVSRQVRNLEDFLGLAVFERIAKRLRLTDAGRLYAGKVAQIMGELEAETFRLMARDRIDNVLTLATFPTFGSFWLIPRLNGFTEAHPDIQLNLITGAVPFDLDGRDIDVAIQHGHGDWPATVAHRVASERMVAVCAPALVAGGDAPAPELPPEAVLRHTLLHLQSRPQAWNDWLAAHGVGATAPVGGPSFEFYNLVTRAAVAGLGVAIMPTIFVEDELRTGQLIAPFGPAMASPNAYYLAYLERKAQLPNVAAFRDWLLAQV